MNHREIPKHSRNPAVEKNPEEQDSSAWPRNFKGFGPLSGACVGRIRGLWGGHLVPYVRVERAVREAVHVGEVHPLPEVLCKHFLRVAPLKRNEIEPALDVGLVLGVPRERGRKDAQRYRVP